jgi:dUTP pyrophosphatase
LTNSTLTPTVKLKRLPHGEGLPLPAYSTAGAAGADLHAAIPQGFPVFLMPGETKLIPTGFSIELPPGWEAQVRSRSGLSLSRGIIILNAPGTIDEDYRGEIGLILHNAGRETFFIERGQRLAQMVICPAQQAIFQEVDELSSSERGTNGYGSTGVQ